MEIVKKVKSNVSWYINYVFGVCIGSSPTSMSSEANDSQSLGSKNSYVSIKTIPRTEGEILQSPNLKSFTFADLKSATRNFRPESVLGEGGFGCVFKGWIDDQSLITSKLGTVVIAVKMLKQGGWQGHQEWLAEVNYLGQFSHPNLVRLIGYCLEDEHRLLVYEFMPCGSLENHLFRRGSYFEPLSWTLRLKVALGAAKGLAFLHSAETQVIYRDFKTSNILLDSDYNAKLSDFGLAKDGPTGDKTHVSTRVMGTQGYVDPEYLFSGHLSTKSDVYSYGVVLLEMLSGRRVLDMNRPPGEQKLVDWAIPRLAKKRKILQVIDNRLRDQYSMKEARQVATLALRCVTRESKPRPSMNEVVSHLEHILTLNEAGGRYVDRVERRLHRRSESVAISQKPNADSAPQTDVSGGIAAPYPRPSDSSLFA